MPSKTMMTTPEFSPPYSTVHGGMTSEEADDMTALVLRHVKAVMKDRGDFNDPRNWSAVADDIAVALDLRENKRYAQRTAWTVVIGKAMAIHTTWTKRLAVKFNGLRDSERLNVWVFYV